MLEAFERRMLTYFAAKTFRKVHVHIANEPLQCKVKLKHNGELSCL